MSNDSPNRPNPNPFPNNGSNDGRQNESLFRRALCFFDNHKYVKFLTRLLFSVLLGYLASYFVVSSLNSWCFRNNLSYQDNSWLKDKAWCKGLNTICDDCLPPIDPEFDSHDKITELLGLPPSPMDRIIEEFKKRFPNLPFLDSDAARNLLEKLILQPADSVSESAEKRLDQLGTQQLDNESQSADVKYLYEKLGLKPSDKESESDNIKQLIQDVMSQNGLSNESNEIKITFDKRQIRLNGKNISDYYFCKSITKAPSKQPVNTALAVLKKKQPDNDKLLLDTPLNVIEYEPELLPAQKKDSKQIYVFRRYVRGNGLAAYDINKDRPKYKEVSKEGKPEECNAIIEPVGYAQYAFARKVSDEEYKCIFVVKVHPVYHRKSDGSVLSFGIHLELLVNVKDPTWITGDENPKDSFWRYPVWYYSDPSGVEELEWYKFKGIAESSEILNVTKKRGNYYEIKLPTSTASLVSWIKNNWVTQTKYKFLENKYIEQDENEQESAASETESQGEESEDKLSNKVAVSLTQEQLETIVCPELERILQEDFSNINTKLPVMLIRICNGSIQFATLWFFWIGIFLMAFMLFTRYREWSILKAAEDLTKAPEQSDNNNPTGVNNPNGNSCNLWNADNFPTDRDQLIAALHGYENSETIDILWSALSIDNNERFYKMSIKKCGKEVCSADGQSYSRDKYDYQELLTFVTMLLNNLERKIVSQWFLWQFFIGSLSALGFLGTVYGIGSALMGTSNVLSDELTKQQSGVSDVALALGTAFDTTMVALTLTLVVSLVSAFFMFNEKRYLYHLKNYICEDFIPVLKRSEDAK